MRSAPDEGRIQRAFEQGLAAEPQPENLDIKALEGASPWLRFRVGDHRIMFRALSREEMRDLAERARAEGNEIDATEGYLVERVVHRHALERAADALPQR